MRNADPDSDGFTIWEEYRGFVLDTGHVRGDSIKKDFFLLAGYPNRQQIQTMLNNTGTGDWIVHEENPPGEVYQSFTWLDTKIFKYSDSSSNLIPNELCFPGIFPDTFVAPEYFNGQWHQGIIPRAFRLDTVFLKGGGDSDIDTAGECRCWPPCRGCGSIDSILVYRRNIEDFMDFLVNPENGYNMPSSRSDDYRNEYVDRDWIHELGEALGLDHVVDGEWNCVMRSGNDYSEFPNNSDNWWSTFHFYSPNLYFCGGSPGLRR